VCCHDTVRCRKAGSFGNLERREWLPRELVADVLDRHQREDVILVLAGIHPPEGRRNFAKGMSKVPISSVPFDARLLASRDIYRNSRKWVRSLNWKSNKPAHLLTLLFKMAQKFGRLGHPMTLAISGEARWRSRLERNSRCRTPTGLCDSEARGQKNCLPCRNLGTLAFQVQTSWIERLRPCGHLNVNPRLVTAPSVPVIPAIWIRQVRLKRRPD